MTKENWTPKEIEVWEEVEAARREYGEALLILREKERVLSSANHRWRNLTFSNPC